MQYRVLVLIVYILVSDLQSTGDIAYLYSLYVSRCQFCSRHAISHSCIYCMYPGSNSAVHMRYCVFALILHIWIKFCFQHAISHICIHYVYLCANSVVDMLIGLLSTSSSEHWCPILNKACGMLYRLVVGSKILQFWVTNQIVLPST